MLTKSDITSHSYRQLKACIRDYLECCKPRSSWKEKDFQYGMIDHLQKLGFNATAEHLFNKTAKDRFPEKNWRVDIVVEIRNNYYEIELKFDNEQNAKNKVKRFINAFWRDVYKLENVIRDNKEIVRGLAIIMSNDKFHNEDRTNALTPKNGTPKQIIYNGYRIRLKGKYKPHWYTTNSSYEYCMIEVK